MLVHTQILIQIAYKLSKYLRRHTLTFLLDPFGHPLQLHNIIIGDNVNNKMHFSSLKDKLI